MTDAPLSDRVEKADRGSRELDAEIATAIDHLEAVAGMLRLPHYSTSLDAARLLVPDAAAIHVFIFPKRSTVILYCGPDENTDDGVKVSAATPALALVAAALKARGL